MTHTWLLADSADTERLGAALGLSCPWGETARVIHLRGELGAGKTSLAAAALAALGVQEAVRSPSYSLLEIYPLQRRQAVHLDLYRLHDAGELAALGLRDYLTGQSLLLIEWPERGGGALPPPDLEIELAVPEHGRRCVMRAASVSGEGWLAAITRGVPGSDPS